MYGPSQVMAVIRHKFVQSLSIYQRVSDEEKMKMGDSLTENSLPAMPLTLAVDKRVTQESVRAPPHDLQKNRHQSQ
jgi:hypothetical protein